MLHHTIPTCSIIIAEYNNGKYFSDLYASLISQENGDFEVVIVDDCSTDNTVSLIEQTIEKDARFKLMKHIANRGAGAAFKTAIEHTIGEIIIMLGADDALTSLAVKSVIDSYKQNQNATLINFSFYFCNNDLEVIKKSNSYNQATEKEYFYLTTKGLDTFRKSSYRLTVGFDESLRSAVDQDICFKLEEVGDVLFIDVPVCLYRNNINGISQEGNHFLSKLNYFIAVFN